MNRGKVLWGPMKILGLGIKPTLPTTPILNFTLVADSCRGKLLNFGWVFGLGILDFKIDFSGL